MKMVYIFILLQITAIITAPNEQNCTDTGIISKIKTLPDQEIDEYFNLIYPMKFYCPKPIGFHCFDFIKKQKPETIPRFCLPRTIFDNRFKICKKNADCGDRGFCQKFISYDIDPKNKSKFALKIQNTSFCYQQPFVTNETKTRLLIDKKKLGFSICNKTSDCKPTKFGSICDKNPKYAEEFGKLLFDGFCVEKICGGKHEFNETYEALNGYETCKAGIKYNITHFDKIHYRPKCIEGILCYRKVECTRGTVFNEEQQCGPNSKPNPLLFCNNGKKKGPNWCDFETNQCCEDEIIGHCPYGIVENRSFRYFQPKCKSDRDCKNGFFCASEGYCCENIQYPEAEGPPISFYLVPAIMIAFIVGGLAFLIFYKFEEVEDL
ncbi:unnamed protein product [Caenorhabditis angaria]|uniref:Domain of unknown function DX domain-containing protein n=1 Tax=Caenorhabditis angaria TaxID=860376 RepID=A0A9P1IF54_9PELO|nr:unnamed protein product [Caenorhabditis angaria]